MNGAEVGAANTAAHTADTPQLLAALVSELIEARDEKKLLRFQKQIASYELLIVDELGFVPLSKTGAELRF
jgi:DNA replication protein DnaC